MLKPCIVAMNVTMNLMLAGFLQDAELLTRAKTLNIASIAGGACGAVIAFMAWLLKQQEVTSKLENGMLQVNPISFPADCQSYSYYVPDSPKAVLVA